MRKLSTLKDQIRYGKAPKIPIKQKASKISKITINLIEFKDPKKNNHQNRIFPTPQLKIGS